MYRKQVSPPHLVQSSRFRRSPTAARMVSLLLGYMFCRTSSSSPSRQASGSRTVTSFILLTPYNINALLLILRMTLKLKAIQISFRTFFIDKAIIQDYINRSNRIWQVCNKSWLASWARIVDFCFPKEICVISQFSSSAFSSF
jgi:hypothetical protein